MSDLLKVLSNIRSLRVLTRKTSLEQLESALEKLTLVIEEKREQEKLAAQSTIERQERLKKYRVLLKEDGITKEELLAIFENNSPKKTRKPLVPPPAKYRYTASSGETKTWTGRGRTPREIQNALNMGKTLKDFEI